MDPLSLVNDDLVREIALLAWLNKSETGEDMFRLITGQYLVYIENCCLRGPFSILLTRA